MASDWHPFIVRPLSQDPTAVRIGLFYRNPLGLEMLDFSWERLSYKVRQHVWKMVSQRRQMHGYDPTAVIRDLFPEGGEKWERLFLKKAQQALKEAARGR